MFIDGFNSVEDRVALTSCSSAQRIYTTAHKLLFALVVVVFHLTHSTHAFHPFSHNPDIHIHALTYSIQTFLRHRNQINYKYDGLLLLFFIFTLLLLLCVRFATYHYADDDAQQIFARH